ncbi:MAG: hypothetical protein HXY41_06920 [Chloroflexi bacterium]|nr:hypothetical protein [Chloroflexota bacterium]
MKRLMRHMLRRGQTGQTIVIMAFGFIVLLGFVGIVTDVSLLFVRYSTLRRAVDSAAVAAAGQVRRATPTQAERDEAAAKGLDVNGIAYARNLATVNLAARQFIEFYGLTPSAVLVETCISTDYSDPELCTEDQRKLVRVTAQLESPTVFLRLLGWGSVRLEASAISETAVLDVVLIMDVSESMLSETSHEDWAAIPQRDGSYADKSARIVPPRADQVPGGETADLWEQILTYSNGQILSDPRFNPPNQPNAFRAFVMNGSTPVEVSAGDSRLPHPNCRVRFWPAGTREIPNGAAGGYDPDDNLLQEFSAFLGISYPTKFSRFQLGYNFYGCCNDPDQDQDFYDLVCQPFKQARDASVNFIKQVDFARGDRVAIVTFDRGATLMVPEHPPGKDVSHMIDNEANAVNILQKAVGVRAESNFYADTNDDGLWDGFKVNFGTTAVRYDYADYWNSVQVGKIVDYPVKDSCPFHNAYLGYPRSLYSSTSDTSDPDYNALRFPSALTALVKPIMIPNYNESAWGALLPSGANPALYTYELRASCRGTNMGAALRTANNALLDPATKRTNGAVWVMVMLSDGAAGASDPAYINKRALTLPNPYTDPADPPLKGEYGVYGVCPTGTTANPAELVRDEVPGFPYCSDPKPESRHFCFDPRDKLDDGSIYTNLGNPSCDVNYYDVDDYARDWADYVGLIDPYPWLKIGSSSSDRNDLQLPTIFTIGFGLGFEQGDKDAEDNPEDFLGEELLRYIADVGDNFQIDTDYQQDLRNDGQPNLLLNPDDEWGLRGPCEDPIPGYNTVEDVKAAGLPHTTIIVPKAPGENCGNYFNATNGLELQLVFDEIAARMFTRLAR